jgi:transcriptional regulator with XRE-family HTH domain
MADQANAPRKATVKLLTQQLEALKSACGIVIKTTRAYKSAQQPQGATQQDVSTQSGLSQNEVSRLENGTFIPEDSELDDALEACGFDLSDPGASAFRNMLQFIRDNESDVRSVEEELPGQ